MNKKWCKTNLIENKVKYEELNKIRRFYVSKLRQAKIKIKYKIKQYFRLFTIYLYILLNILRNYYLCINFLLFKLSHNTSNSFSLYFPIIENSVQKYLPNSKYKNGLCMWIENTFIASTKMPL